jgi:bifunctional non-homologous end joining protein LigD
MLTKAFLDELKLKSFLKTSGGKGLHVVVPLSPVADWDEIKDFSEAIVVHLARTVPTALRCEKLVRKIGSAGFYRLSTEYPRRATTAAAFSARARPDLASRCPSRGTSSKAWRARASGISRTR